MEPCQPVHCYADAAAAGATKDGLSLPGATLAGNYPSEEPNVDRSKVWLITGASRGLGVDLAKAALAAGDSVIATGRDAAKVAAAVGARDNVLAVKLDVTRPEDAHSAVAAGVAKFGRIDILVNNAGNFFARFQCYRC